MALMQHTELGMRRTGTTTTVANDPRARLMYYLSCLDNVLDISSEPGFLRLTRYSDYWLDADDTDRLIVLCYLLSPDELIDKCIFHSDELCGDSGNEFFELSAVRTELAVAGTVLIGGQRRQVHKIMTFKMDWLRRNWVVPIQELVAQRREQKAAENRRLQQQQQQRAQKSCSCTIL